MIKSFKEFNEEKTNEVAFTFGRFNPPTTGHGKLLTKVAAEAIGNEYRIYASQSNDKDKNPLEYKEKIKVMRKMFPKHGRNIIEDKKAKTVFDILTSLYDQGYNKVKMIVGSDRVSEFSKLISKYNGAKGRHGYYSFPNGVEVVSAGERDPDAEGVSGMSASKMRQAVVDGDFKSFMLGVPKGYGKGMTLFNLIRKRMGLKEKTNFREHIELPSISETREKYVAGEIFKIGDIVYCGEKKVVIKERKSNYIIDERDDKYFINDLSETINKAYGKGLSKSTKAKRQAQFNKQAKMDDDDPKAYKPAPGDKRSKTKLSKHTIAYRKKFGEWLGEDDPCWSTHKQVGMKKNPKGKGVVPNCVPKNEVHEWGTDEGVKAFKDVTPGELAEKQLAGLKKKSEESGIAYGILKQVFNRGMAAWKTGHRPGATPHQWAYARVNSFITGGKTRTTADKDLWAKHKSSKKESLEEAKFDVAFDGFEGEWTNLKDELKKMRIKISNHYDDDGRHEFTVDTNKAKLKQLMKKFGDLEMNESLKEIKEPYVVFNKKTKEVLATGSNSRSLFARRSGYARDNGLTIKDLEFKRVSKKQEVGTKLKEATDSCEAIFEQTIEEAEYQGKKVKLNDPIRTSENPNKKFKVYVKNDKGKVVVVRFGDPNMEIKRDDPERRKNFRARHNCDNPGPKTKARYWSCYQWRGGAKVDN